MKHGGKSVEVGYLLKPEDDFENQPIGYGLTAEGGEMRLRKPALFQAAIEKEMRDTDVVQTAIVAFENGERLTLDADRHRQYPRRLQGPERVPAAHGADVSWEARSSTSAAAAGSTGRRGVEYNQLVIR